MLETIRPSTMQQRMRVTWGNLDLNFDLKMTKTRTVCRMVRIWWIKSCQ